VIESASMFVTGASNGVSPAEMICYPGSQKNFVGLSVKLEYEDSGNFSYKASVNSVTFN
jgi:hypothetical protein